MKLIDRYVYAVTEHLPQDSRDDVSRELRANIEDMLPENPTEKDVRTVLERLGNPVKLANEYSTVKKYLIGPGLYDSYISVLKLVASILPIVLVSTTLLAEMFVTPSDGGMFRMSVDILVNMIVAAIQGVIQGFLWVTMVFVILERTGVGEGKTPFVKKDWSPDDLPILPVTNKSRISRGETVFTMIFTIIFAAILYFQPELAGLYWKGDSGLTLIAPVFVTARLRSYIFIILVLTAFQFGILVWKFVSKRWNYPLAVANTVHNIAGCVLVFVMINDNALFNQGFISSFADLTKTSLSQMAGIWLNGIRAFTAVFMIISLWDSIEGFIKSRK